MDAPPAPRWQGVGVCGAGESRGAAGRASAVHLDAGALEVVLAHGEVVRVDGRALVGLGDGRAPIDAVLRPDGHTVAITWRNGRRARYDVSWLAAAALSLAA